MPDAGGIAYEEAGAGPALLLVHGHPFDRSMWRPQLISLAADFRVVAPDLPGYGASPPRGSTTTMPEFAAAVLELADRLGIERCVVAGLSIGGRLQHPAARAGGAEPRHRRRPRRLRRRGGRRQLIGALPAPEVVRLPGAGHLPNLEAGTAFDAALRAFALRVSA